MIGLGVALFRSISSAFLPLLSPLCLSLPHLCQFISLCVCVLYCSGAQIEAQDDDSYTPLMTAVAHGQKEAMVELISRGADVELFDRDGKSIIFIAAEHNQLVVLKVTKLLHYLGLSCQSPCHFPSGTHIRQSRSHWS